MLALLAASPAYAASYVKADFSSGIFGGNANVRDTWLSLFSP